MSVVYTPQPGPQYTNPDISDATFNSELFQSYWFWLLVLLVLIALGIAIGVLIWIGTREDTVVNRDLSIQQTSSASTTSDTFKTNEFDLYIGVNTGTLNLNIPANDTNRKGREIFIKNDGTANINIDTRSLVNFKGGQITNPSAIESGVYGVFIFESQNSLLRLQ